MTAPTEHEILYSTDGETFRPDFGEMIDALESDGELEVGRQYESCEARPVTVDDIGIKSVVEYMLENIAERMFDLRCLAEDADIRDDITNDAGKELEDFVASWCKRNVLDGNQYSVILHNTIKTHTITAEDIQP